MHSDKVKQAIREFKSMMSRPIFESVDGMARFELKKILAKVKAQAGTASCSEVAEGKLVRICETPGMLPEGIPSELKLSDGLCKKTYNGGRSRINSHIWYDTYTIQENPGVDANISFFSKDVTFDEMVQYYEQYYYYSKDNAFDASADVKRDIVEIFAGYVYPERAFINIFGGYACKNAYGTVRQKAAAAKKREEAWKKRTLRGIDIDKKFAPITTPDDSDSADMERFEKEIDALFGGSVYGVFVPDEYEDVEGERRDLDDWDIYKVNRQSTIDEEGFWERIYDRLYEDYDVNQTVKASELMFWFEKAGSEIAEDALENYEPDENELIHRSIYKNGAY